MSVTPPDNIGDPFRPAPHARGRFRNLVEHEPHGFLTALHWLATRRPPPWPRNVAASVGPKPVPRVDGARMRVTLIGHATVLIQVAGLNLITDPIWSERAGPVSWFGPKRVRPAGIAFDDLPPINAVLLSHSHYDHLDRPTLKALLKRDRPLVVTGLKVGAAVPGQPRAVELDWWQSHALSGGVTATYVPAQHFSARGPFDRNKRLWGGFVLESPAGTIYFSGDTGQGPHIAAIRRRFGPMRLALLPIGAYLPRWFMASVHMSPEEAVDACETLEAAIALPLHYGVFPLADDSYGEPLRMLNDALEARRAAGRALDFRAPEFGEAVEIV
ncbi:MAG: MBL fold metallo-hydrolase [Pseudolabrys sp.]|jgi:L-ascorbate metabolism protein UlaG (beta-lactamase superfamily)